MGEAVSLSGVPYTIVGVLPQDFQFAPGGNEEFWTTLHASDSCALRRSCHNFVGIARLKDGVSVEMALANMKAIAGQLELQYPKEIAVREPPSRLCLNSSLKIFAPSCSRSLAELDYCWSSPV